MLIKRKCRADVRGVILFLATVLALSALAASAARSDQPAFEEYKVKAAYLYNIAKFVAWPEKAPTPPDSTFVIAILGQDPFGRELDTLLTDRTVGGRHIRLKRAETVAALGRCDVLFVARSLESEVHPILEQLSGRPVLTVSDMTEFGENGGMVTFYLEGDRVRFDINQEAALKAGLTVSSRLLSLAQPHESDR